MKLLKAKIHRATVTDANLDYEGSVSVDSDLLEKSGILPFEAVSIYNITNGARIETYTLKGSAGSGTICINGAAAHHCRKGDLVIICAYAHMTPEDAQRFEPKVVLVDKANRSKGASSF